MKDNPATMRVLAHDCLNRARMAAWQIQRFYGREDVERFREEERGRAKLYQERAKAVE